MLETAKKKNKGKDIDKEELEAFYEEVRAKYERETHPMYGASRLWVDAVIDPAETRMVLGLSLSASLNAPVEDTPFGVFRM